MYNSFSKGNAGEWETVLGATISAISNDGSNFDQNNHTIYGNGRHKAIVRVKVKLGGRDSKPLMPDQYPTPDFVLSCVHLGNYNDTEGFILIGAGDSAGWIADTEHNCFMCPLTPSGSDPISIDASTLVDRIENSVAFVHYFVSYNPDVSGPRNFSLGVKIQCEDKFGILKGQPYYISSSHPDNGIPINLTALPAIVFKPDDFDWTGTRIFHEGEYDDFMAGQPPLGNFWREIAYTVQLKDNIEYPNEVRYSSKITRCEMLSNGYYREEKINNYQDYSFGMKRNGFYAFTGYLWPYNIYNEEQALKPDGKPIIPPPAPKQGPTDNNFRMMADGMPVMKAHVPYAKYQLNFSLFCTFGWTSNDFYDYYPLYLLVYDQYGNVGALAADPTLIPDKYTDPAAQDGLCQQQFLAVLADQKPAAPEQNARDVYFKLVATDKDNGTKYCLALDVRDRDPRFPMVLKMDEDSPPDSTELILFRCYRNNGGTGEVNLFNSELNFAMINYKYRDLGVYIEVFNGVVVVTRNIGGVGWRLVPIWKRNNIALYYENSDVRWYISIDTMTILEWMLKGTYKDAAKSMVLEWSVLVETDPALGGDPDEGIGY